MNTKRKRLAVLLAVFALIGLLTFGAFATEAQTSGDFTYVVENDAAVITGYSGNDENLTIPATLGGYPVKEIGQYVFYYCSQIKSLTFSEGIEKIGDYAFGGCSELKALSIPNSLKIIGMNAFAEIGITELTVPEGVESIGNSAFEGCMELKKATLLNKAEKISDYAFYRCIQLTKVDIPDTVKVIGEGAFKNCFELENVKLPSGLTTIGQSAFQGCASLESVVFPASLTKIGALAFSDTGLTELNVPASVVSIGYNAFETCYNLKGATVSAKVEKIADGLFDHCTSLKSVKLPDTVKEIGVRAFSGCFKLSEINLPKSLKTIGSYALDDCNALTSIVIPDKVTSIGERAFYSCSGLKLADTGNAAKIGEGAFADCDKLEQVVFGSKLKTINKKAFTLPLNAKERIYFCYRGTKTQWKDVTIKCNYLDDEPIHCGYTESHLLKNAVKKANLNVGGTIYEKCSVCDFKRAVDSFAKPAFFSLSAESYVYNKKVQTPSVTVKDADGAKLKKDRDYTVKYESGRKLPGKYTVTITFKGDYEGTKKLAFTITPRKVEKLTATATKITVTLKWNKATGADGYRVYKYNSKTKKYENFKSTTATSLKITDLKTGTTYKFKVRAYVKDVDTIYGEYSSVVSVTTKLSDISKLSAKNGKTSVKLTWSKVNGADGYRVYYKSGDTWNVIEKSVKDTTYTVKNLKSGTKRTYAVRAYKKTSGDTLWSARKTITATTTQK